MLSKQEMQDIVNKYARCMQEIKNRTDAIRAIWNQKCTTLYPITNTEFMALQLRKILELIALANLVTNKERYETIRASFATDWNANGILKTIKNFNPNYFPEGIIRIPSETPEVQCHWDYKKSNVLTEELFKNAFDEVSCFLHAKNPFNEKEEDLSIINSKILFYMDLIINLLSEHTVTLCNKDKVNCTMEAYEPTQPLIKKV